jgi:hypothetical protein
MRMVQVTQDRTGMTCWVNPAQVRRVVKGKPATYIETGDNGGVYVQESAEDVVKAITAAGSDDAGG